jgi:hypothetical protein
MQREWTPQPGFAPCLSIKQPWTWLIIHSLKDIENRDWTTSYRGALLIHAGKRVDEQCFDSGGRLLIDYWRSRYGDELVARMPQHQREYETGGIVGIATVVDVVTHSESPWFFGRYGWVLKDMAGSSKRRIPCPSSPIVASSASLAYLWTHCQLSMLTWWDSETRLRCREEPIQADDGNAGTIERAMATLLLVIRRQ